MVASHKLLLLLLLFWSVGLVIKDLITPSSAFSLWGMTTLEKISILRRLSFLMSGFNSGQSLGLGFPDGLDSEEFACNARDTSLIPGLRRWPEEGNGYPWSCLENSMEFQKVGHD